MRHLYKSYNVECCELTSYVTDNLMIYKNRFAQATPNADFITHLSEGVFVFLAAILFQFA